MVETVNVSEEPDTQPPPTNFSGMVDLPDTNTLYIVKVNLYFEDSWKNDDPAGDGTVADASQRAQDLVDAVQMEYFDLPGMQYKFRLDATITYYNWADTR